MTPYFEDLIALCRRRIARAETAIMDALFVSTDPEVVLKLDSTIPRAFQRVIVAVAYSSLTIGEDNRNLSRVALWFAFVFVPSFTIFSAAGRRASCMTNCW
jgi:hypothetical protein